MTEIVKKKRIETAVAGLFGLACVLVLSACTGGTTYGTGVTQGKQTVSDVYNMFSLKRESKNIDYSDRPDLIVPDNRAALPAPVDIESTTSNPDWPETPEQRVARIRAQAGEVDARSGDYGIRENLRKKEGIAVETDSPKEKFVVGKTDRDGNPLHYSDPGGKARQKVLNAKADREYSRGATTRKFLSEPPVAYRTPAESAPQGEEAFTEEQLAERKAAEEKRKKEEQEYNRIGPNG